MRPSHRPVRRRINNETPFFTRRLHRRNALSASGAAARAGSKRFYALRARWACESANAAL